MAWYGRGYGYDYGGWAPYVPVAEKKAKASKHAAQVAKKEKREVAPVHIDGNKIAKTFWGKAWCDNLEQYSDFSNRLPRGRTYVRNGSVVDLQIKPGKVQAIVAGSEVYKVTIAIDKLESKKWKKIQLDCSRSIESLLDLLRGKFDQGVMQRLTERETGLFPKPREIKMNCSCPDSAGVCKHIAAVMYGVGSRLDRSPEMLFLLREVDHLELIAQAATAENIEDSLTGKAEGALAGSDLGELFGIELDDGQAEIPSGKSGATKASKSKKPKIPVAIAKVKAVAKPTVKTKAAKKAERPAPVSAGKTAAGETGSKKTAAGKNVKRTIMAAATRKKQATRNNQKET